MTTKADPVAVSDELVLRFLREKGYSQTAETFQKEKPVETHLMPLLLDGHTHAAHPIANFNKRENSPDWYAQSYDLVRECVNGQLVREELSPILWPVYVHMYLELIRNNFRMDALKFLEKYRADHDRAHSEEIKSLQANPNRETVAPVAQQFRKKVNVQVSMSSFEVLKHFLDSNQLSLLMGIINKSVTFDIISRDPLTAGAEISIDPSKEKVRWGVLKEIAAIYKEASEQRPQKKPLAEKPEEGSGENVSSSSSSSSSANNGEGSSNNNGAPTKKRRAAKDGSDDDDRDDELMEHLESSSILIPTETIAISDVPLPNPILQEEEKIQMLADLQQRARLSSTALPSICFYTFLNSSDCVNSISISNDGSLVSAGLSDSSVRTWDLKAHLKPGEYDKFKYKSQSQPMYKRSDYPVDSKPSDPLVPGYSKLVGHCGPVFSTHLSHDHQFLLSASEDATVRLWHMDSKMNFVAYKGHNNPIWAVRFSPLGFYFATASNDCTARLWSTDKISPLRMFVGHTGSVDCVEFHPNCNYVATGSADKCVRLWDVNKGESVRLFRGPTAGIRTLALSPDGRCVAAAGEDQNVYVWDLASGKQLEKFTGHQGTVTSLDFSREGSLLASGSLDQTVRLWSMESPSSASGTASNEPKQPIRTFRTKSSSVTHVNFTGRNLLMCAGVFLAG